MILPYCSCHVSVLDAPAKPLQIRVYDDAGNVIATPEHKGDFKEWWHFAVPTRKRALAAMRGCRLLQRKDTAPYNLTADRM